MQVVTCDGNVNDRPHEAKWIPWLMVGLLLLGSALVWHDLGRREVLGRDENATITKLDQPDLKAVLDVTYMKVTGEPGNMQPLYFVVQYLFWPLVGRSAFVFRFLSSAFGLLVVILTYKLGEALFRRGACRIWPGHSVDPAAQVAGLIGALFTALLPLHLRYAQIARPYTLLAALSLASAYFLVRALSTNRLAHWVGFVLTAALNFYNHYNALFVLAIQGLFVGVVWLAALAVTLRERGSPARLLGPVFSFLALGFLCAPGLIRLVTMPWVLDGGGELGDAVTVELAVPFFRHYLYMSGLKTVPVQNLFFGLTFLGLVATLYRRRWAVALFLTFWLAVPFVILALLTSPRPFEERYVIFVTPVAFLSIAYGLVTVGELLGGLARRRGIGGVRRALTAAMMVGLALIFVAPLRTYYAINREADRLEQALVVVERHARPGDLIVVSPRIFLRPLDAGGADVLYLSDHLSPDELDGLALRSQRMWILYSSYLPPAELQEPLDRWVQSQGDLFVRVPIKSISALAYGATSPADAATELKDRAAMLAELAEDSGGRYEAWQRYSALADAYEALADLYASQGQAARAQEYRAKAEQARAAAPPP